MFIDMEKIIRDFIIFRLFFIFFFFEFATNLVFNFKSLVILDFKLSCEFVLKIILYLIVIHK